MSSLIRSVQIFPRADIPRFRVLENPPSVPKSTILIDQDVAYFRNPDASPTKVLPTILESSQYLNLHASSHLQTVNSLLTLETNDSYRVTCHTEEWDHKHETTKDDGFLGMLNEQRKKFTAGLTNMVVGQEPPKSK